MVDSIEGLSPAISISQSHTNRNPRSNVGTVMEISPYLRVIFSRLGERPCPHCQKTVKQSYSEESETIFAELPDQSEENTEIYEEMIPCPHCGKSIIELTASHFSYNKPSGACPNCKGVRFRREILEVTAGGKNILDILEMPLTEVSDWIGGLYSGLSEEAMLVVHDVLEDLLMRIKRVINAGVGYLSLDQGSSSLSPGEIQRIKLASILGSNLTGVLYILDESTVGLHSRDTRKVIDSLCKLRDTGNTVIVIEHDIEVMRAADYIVDFGPGAGKYGGEIVAAGSVSDIAACESSITIDQSSIGRSSRSNIATYTDIFTDIRNLFAELAVTQKCNLQARHFSYNVSEGRCEKCHGAGKIAVSMNFLPDIEVTCPVCRGNRYQKPVLEVRYKEHTIADVLNLGIDEAANLFQSEAEIHRKLRILQDVGLGYLGLGQSASTLSGGEAQRLKLAKELSRSGSKKTLYLFDEPSNGLHPHDANRMIHVFDSLVKQGSSVIIIEHNVDMILASDWIIDMGPEGGKKGGRIMAQGTPEKISKIKGSATGELLGKKI